MGLSQAGNDRTVRSYHQCFESRESLMAQDKDVTAEVPLQEAPRATPMVPSPPGGQGVSLAPAAKAKPRRGVRSLILPAIILAAVGYGGMKAYDWFVEGRF